MKSNYLQAAIKNSKAEKSKTRADIKRKGEKTMKVLVVGSGGREHAICQSIAKSPRVEKIYCAPGNAGIGQIAECVSIGAMEFDKLAGFAKKRKLILR